jgi:hypothetical protein
MKKFLIFLAILLLPLILWIQIRTVYGIDVEPKVVGSAATDSVFITFGTIDTTYYPSVANADSLIILIYPPDNDLPESLGEGGSIFNRTPGYYEYHRKAVNADGDLGVYRVMVVAWRGGAKRGIQTCNFTVTSAGTYYYGVIDSSRDDGIAIKSKTDLLAFTTRGVKSAVKELDEDSLTGEALDLDGTTIGTVINVINKAGYKLASDGLDADTSFTNLQTVSAGIKAKTDKLTFNAQDSLIVDYSNIPTGGLTPAEHDTLFKIRNYSYAVEETIKAHAPHGNDWGQGGGGSGETDTALIKIMNNNNSWGAYYTWNYTTRTLTSGAGSGANSVVIRCKQSSDSTNIAGAQIQVLDSIQNSTIGLLNSDSQGRAFFALNNGVYCVRIHKPGWQFTVPETLRVSGNKDTTYYAGAYSPGSPPLPILCRVYGWVYDINNQPVVGAKIEASIKTIPLRYENVIISPYYKSTTTDDEGYWYLDLYPNSVLSPYDTKYIFFIYSPSGTILRIETTVPNQTSWELQF